MFSDCYHSINAYPNVAANPILDREECGER